MSTPPLLMSKTSGVGALQGPGGDCCSFWIHRSVRSPHRPVPVLGVVPCYIGPAYRRQRFVLTSVTVTVTSRLSISVTVIGLRWSPCRCCRCRRLPASRSREELLKTSTPPLIVKSPASGASKRPCRFHGPLRIHRSVGRHVVRAVLGVVRLLHRPSISTSALRPDVRDRDGHVKAVRLLSRRIGLDGHHRIRCRCRRLPASRSREELLKTSTPTPLIVEVIRRPVPSRVHVAVAALAPDSV